MPLWRRRNTQRARNLRNNATPAERALWVHLQNRKLGGFKFSRQLELDGPIYPDFTCRSHGLIVELDGDSHDFTGEADLVRTRRLEALGYNVIRFTNKDVFENMDGVLTAIAQELESLPTPPLRGYPLSGEPSPGRFRSVRGTDRPDNRKREGS